MPTRLFPFAALLALVGAASVLPAQVRATRPPQERDETRRLAQTIISRFDEDADRPRLGIAVESRGASDTLGLLVSDVTADGPADKAGVKTGDRLLAINAVSLRLDSADAADPAMQGVATRRLTRELARHEIGDEVTLRLMRDGRPLTLTVTTSALSDVRPRSVWTRGDRNAADRASLGIALASTGSVRDTLGVFITNVSRGGPADKAGVQEGDRIASINGVDLRVPREDVEDWMVSSARVRRLSRELEKLKVGDQVTLRLIRAGQARTVALQTVAASELPGRGGRFFFGDGGLISTFDFAPHMIAPVPPVPPVPPSPPVGGALERPPLPPRAPLAPGVHRWPDALRWFYFDEHEDEQDRPRGATRSRIERLSEVRS